MAKTMKSSILVFLALMAVTPILKTLTGATSSDSIWALSAILFILNMLLADYGDLEPKPHRLTSVLSMNAAISSGVVLASRLQSNLEVFALVLSSVLLFALFPLLHKKIQQRATVLIRTGATTLFAIASILSLGQASKTAAVIAAAVLVFVTFLCPAVLVWAQRYKNEIRGPWDPAVPVVKQWS